MRWMVAATLVAALASPAAAAPTVVWKSTLCPRLSTTAQYGTVVEGGLMICGNSPSPTSPNRSVISLATGELLWNLTGVLPNTIFFVYDPVENVTYAQEPLMLPKVGTSLVRFTPARTEPTLYAGSMATNVAVTAKGLVKQWDFSAIGRADFELKDWESEYDYPRTPYGSTFNTVNIAGGLGARDAGVISWYFDTSSVYLLRIDGESSKANASLLAPTWVITLAEGLESPSSYGPSFAVLGPRLAVLDSTNNESVALRVYSAATGKPEWHTEVKLPSAPGKSARAQFSAAWDGNLACTLASVDVFGASQSVSEWPSNASTRPPGRGSNERRGAAAPPPPNPLSELACYDVEASTRLWTVPVHHRPFHPLDGWEQGEFAGTMVVTSKGVLVRCLKYIWNKETKNWNSQSTHIRAYDISGNLHWTIPVDNTFIAAAQVTGAFFRGGGDLGDAIELLTV